MPGISQVQGTVLLEDDKPKYVTYTHNGITYRIMVTEEPVSITSFPDQEEPHYTLDVHGSHTASKSSISKKKPQDD